MKNLIVTKITQEDKDAVDSQIGDIESVFTGKLVEISDDERVKYGSINEQNKLLVNKIQDYRNSDPALSSPDIDWDEFERDFQARSFLETRLARLRKLVHMMESTKILHDYDNFQTSLREYAYTQFKKDTDVEGFSEKFDQLKVFFPRGKQIVIEEPEPTP